MLTSNINDDELIISVKEARKLIGQKSKNLTNEELESLIRNAQTLAHTATRHFIGSKKLQNHDMINPEDISV